MNIWLLGIILVIILLISKMLTLDDTIQIDEKEKIDNAPIDKFRKQKDIELKQYNEKLLEEDNLEKAIVYNESIVKDIEHDDEYTLPQPTIKPSIAEQVVKEEGKTIHEMDAPISYVDPSQAVVAMNAITYESPADFQGEKSNLPIFFKNNPQVFLDQYPLSKYVPDVNIWNEFDFNTSKLLA